jgi:hypothetical protein
LGNRTLVLDLCLWCRQVATQFSAKSVNWILPKIRKWLIRVEILSFSCPVGRLTSTKSTLLELRQDNRTKITVFARLLTPRHSDLKNKVHRFEAHSISFSAFMAFNRLAIPYGEWYFCGRDLLMVLRLCFKLNQMCPDMSKSRMKRIEMCKQLKWMTIVINMNQWWCTRSSLSDEESKESSILSWDYDIHVDDALQRQKQRMEIDRIVSPDMSKEM